MISFSNSHFLLGSLSSHYATNLQLCRVAPLLSDKLHDPRRHGREMCQTRAVPQGCLVGQHWVQLPRSQTPPALLSDF